MNENEILEVELELGNGNKIAMKIQESEYWDEIPSETRALICLCNGQKMVVVINSADYEEGVTFKVIGASRTYCYDASLIQQIFIEVTE